MESRRSSMYLARSHSPIVFLLSAIGESNEKDPDKDPEICLRLDVKSQIKEY